MKQAMIERKYYLVFFAALLALSIHFKYYEILFYFPQSADIWRQSDCASFAYNYYQHGMHFFEPEVHNMLSGSGKAVGECPLIYYFVALLYKLFGPHIFLFRLVNLSIFYFGLLALFRFCYRITSDIFFSAIIPLLLFASPIILFYANNFLSDVPSLSFVFMALNRLLVYRESKRLKDFWICMLFFTLAGLLKANSIIVFVAIGSLFFIEWNNWNEKEPGKLFPHNLLNALGFAASLAVVIAWYRWAIHYNEVNHSTFLGTRSWPGWPLWEVSRDDLDTTLIMLFRDLNELFTLPLSALFFFLVPFVLLNLGSLSYFLKGSFVLVLTGTVIFFVFFFVGFKEQGYYFVNLMILPVLSFLCAVEIMQNRFPQVSRSFVFRTLALALLLTTVYNGKASTKIFYRDGWKHTRLNSSFYDAGLVPYMESIGIHSEDIVLSIPDDTPNASLYLLNRKGWTNYGFENSRVDVAGVENKIIAGCRYLVVSGNDMLRDSVVAAYASKPLGTFKDLHFYKLYSLGQPVFLRNAQGLYASANESGMLEMSRTPKSLYLLNLGKDRFSLRTASKKFVSCKAIEDHPLMANGRFIFDREKFLAEKTDSSGFVIKTFDNLYLGLKNGELRGSEPERMKAERFYITAHAE